MRSLKRQTQATFQCLNLCSGHKGSISVALVLHLQRFKGKAGTQVSAGLLRGRRQHPHSPNRAREQELSCC